MLRLKVGWRKRPSFFVTNERIVLNSKESEKFTKMKDFYIVALLNVV